MVLFAGGIGVAIWLNEATAEDGSVCHFRSLTVNPRRLACTSALAGTKVANAAAAAAVLVKNSRRVVLLGVFLVWFSQTETEMVGTCQFWLRSSRRRNAADVDPTTVI